MSKLKATPDEIRAFKARLMDRAWCILAPKDVSLPGASSRLMSACNMLGLKDFYPCMAVSGEGVADCVFIEGNDPDRIRKLQALTGSFMFVSNQGYDGEDGGLDFDTLYVGNVDEDAFSKGYFVVVTDWKVIELDTGRKAISANTILAFGVAGKK